MSGEQIRVKLNVNGRDVEAHVAPGTSLLRYLRDSLGLVGAKDGCSSGHCGACTVILNGRATRACLVRVEKVDGARVETIEGLARDGELHPIQRAFVEHGAVQCGFCTPGMVMTAKALLDANPDPSAEEIKRALTVNRNLCRCTGYVPVVEAIRAAAARLRGSSHAPEPDGDLLSNPAVRKDKEDRVTGRAIFADDLAPPGVLYGKILWAAHPHAEIRGIDTSQAARMPGVAAVVTAQDIPGLNQAGIVIRDQPAIAATRVRYTGDSLAAVFAESPEQAEAALGEIRVAYQPLPGVLSPEEAARPGAPLVHAERGSNLLHRASIVRGDVEAAFAGCAVVVEETYTTPRVEHGFLEPESGLASPTGDGGVRVEYPTQTVFDDRAQLAGILGMPEDKIRVVQLPQGGSFGGKEDLIFHQYLALGALKTGRPVKITLTRAESLRAHVKRHPALMWYKTGANANGKLLAVQSRVVLDSGAYASLGIDVAENTLTFGAGPYYVPNLQLEVEAWYTNSVPSGAMRGFGANQVAFALEQQMDAMARALKLDPFTFRLMNALDAGLPTASDHVLEPGVAAIKETLLAARQALEEKACLPCLEGYQVGIGVACGVKNVGFGHNLPDDAGAILELHAGGELSLRYTQHDFGQGARAALVRLAADELGVPAGKIRLVGPDTALTPYTGPTTASRQTFITGNAVLLACRALKEELLRRAAGVLQAAAGELRFTGQTVIHPETCAALPLEDLVGDGLVVEERYRPPSTAGLLREPSHYGRSDFESRRTFWGYTYSTQVAIVGVQVETGDVRVLELISANDVGAVLNRQAVEGQIYGGAMMGLGYALSEEFVVEGGVNLTDSLHKCRLPAADRTPGILPVVVEVPHPFGPRGAKGFAEGPSLATTPAILNAIYDAVGVRITALPADRGRVKAAMANGRKGDSLSPEQPT